MEMAIIGSLISALFAALAAFVKGYFERHKKELEDHKKEFADQVRADDIARVEYERNVYGKIDRLQMTVEASSERIVEVQKSTNEELFELRKELMEQKINNDDIKKMIHNLNNIGQVVKMLVEKTKPLQEHYGKVIFLEKKFEEFEKKKKAS